MQVTPYDFKTGISVASAIGAELIPCTLRRRRTVDASAPMHSSNYPVSLHLFVAAYDLTSGPSRRTGHADGAATP